MLAMIMYVTIMVILAYIGVFWAIRSVCDNIIIRLVNKSMRRKMKKNQTFLEWFGYKRFRLEIPKIHIVLIYAAFWFHLSLLLIMIIIVVFHFIPELLLLRIGAGIVIVSWIFHSIYTAYFLGIHWAATRYEHPEKCPIRGIDKKKYMEARRKQRLEDAKSKDDDSSC